MAISFNDEETERLAHRLAEVTGTSVDEAVAEAVRVRLALLEGAPPRPARDVDVSDIQARVAALPVLDPRSPEEMLYDEYGLPK